MPTHTNRLRSTFPRSAVGTSRARFFAAAGTALLSMIVLTTSPTSAQRDASGIFDFLDANGDGVLTRTEARRTGVQAEFHLLDRNGDGTVSCTEFVQGALGESHC